MAKFEVDVDKDTSKIPKFERFANPPIDIKLAVEAMRVVAAAERGTKRRSWSATFKMGKISSKVPAFERFVPQPVIAVSLSLFMSLSPDLSLSPDVSVGLFATHDIRAAVEEMRLATAARRAKKRRSWSATFSMNKISSRIPKHERFADPTSDIKAAVEQMRLATAARRNNKRRSWSTALSLNKISSKSPKHERFAYPTSEIRAAVEQMRLLASAKRAKKQRSWAASFSFNKIPFKTQMFYRFARNPRDVRVEIEEMRAAAAIKRAAKHRSWSASFTMNQISSKTPMYERFANHAGGIKVVVEQMRLLAAATRMKKQRSWSASFAMNRIRSKTPKFDRFANPPSDIRVAVEEMRLAAMQTRAVKREAEAKKEETRAAEIDSLIQEEQIRKLSEELTAQHEIEENEKLVEEELSKAFGDSQQDELPSSTISITPSYLAGSAAIAVRQIRRSVSVSAFQMDADDNKPSRLARESSLARAYSACGAQFYQVDSEERYALDRFPNGRPRTRESERATNVDDGKGKSKLIRSSTSVQSAMAMDLSADLASCTPKVQHTMPGSMISKSPSDGHLTRGKYTSFMPLQPLAMPKSTSFLTPASSIKVGPLLARKTGDGASAWHVDSYSLPLSTHVSGQLVRDTRTSFGAAF